MPDSGEGHAAEPAEPTPNFELSHHDLIREDNWEEYKARGFEHIRNTDGSANTLRNTQSGYGIEHVYTGHPYDYEEDRPLQHKPGTGLYTDPDGLAVNEAQTRHWREFHRRWRQEEEGGGPAAS